MAIATFVTSTTMAFEEHVVLPAPQAQQDPPDERRDWPNRRRVSLDISVSP